MSIQPIGPAVTPVQGRSFWTDAWKECLMRITYFVSKFFLQFFEPFELKNFCNTVKAIGKEIYWSFQAPNTFPRWFQRVFKHSVQQVKEVNLYDYERFDGGAFSSSQEYQTLQARIPCVKVIEAENPRWVQVNEGTCFGQSIMAMKYHAAFDVVQGFTELDPAPWRDKVVFLQSIETLISILMGRLKYQKRLKDAHIDTYEFLSSTLKVDKVYLFHALRRAGVSRIEAHALCDQYSEIFSYPVDELKEQIASANQLVNEVLQDKQLVDLLSSEKGYKNRNQADLDQEVIQCLSEQSGVISLASFGEKKKGHCMFLKIENGGCVVYDPGTQTSFVTEHTPEGGSKIVELMKKMMVMTNRGGKVAYRVSGLVDSNDASA